MKQKLTAFITVLFFSATAFAQNANISIVVKNEKNELLQNVTAKVYGAEDSVLYQKILMPTTVFSLPVNHGYTFELTATNIALTNKLVMLGNSDTTITIVAKTKTKDLDAVVVTARKPLITQDDDKTVVDAEVLSNSSSNAFEVLEKTPGAVVDQDGNVYLNSSTPAQIQINGKEVKLSAADVASLLKSLPANSVVKIEILRNPSAKYDAASSGGIVNIVLKKGVKIGASGSVNLGSFQGKYNTSTTGFNLNNSGTKANTYLSYQFSNRHSFEALSSNRYVAGVNVAQTAFTKYQSYNQWFGGGIDYAFNKKFTLGYETRFSINDNGSDATNDVLLKDEATGNVVGKTNSIITNDAVNTYIDNTITATYKIDSLGSEWSSVLSHDYFNGPNKQVYNNDFILPAYPSVVGDGTIKSKKNIVLFTSDLVFKTKDKYTLETGVKLNFSSSNNNALYYVDSSTGRKLDSFQTNKFKYRENISAAYFQVSKTFYGFTLKPGLRLERTDINGNQLFPKDTTLSIKRTDLFPYVYLRHDLFKLFGFQLTGNAIYRRSITRPYYEVLNPYPKYIDQFLYDVGNPRLQPQFTTNYEFNVNADQFPVFSIGLNDIKDIFTNVTYQDSSSKIAYRTFDNLGRNKEMYMRFVAGVPPGKKYFFYAGTQYNHVNYSGFYQGEPLNYKRGTWTFFMYQNYKPTPTFNVSLNGFMRLRGLQNFYEFKSFGQLNITGNKAILQKKMNIILSVNDIFRTNKYSFVLQQAGIRADGTRANDSRRIGLTLRYNFGLKPKEEKQPMFEAPKEGN